MALKLPHDLPNDSHVRGAICRCYYHLRTRQISIEQSRPISRRANTKKISAGTEKAIPMRRAGGVEDESRRRVKVTLFAGRRRVNTSQHKDKVGSFVRVSRNFALGYGCIQFRKLK